MKKFLLHIGVCFAVAYLILGGIDKIITNNLHHSDALIYHRWNDLIYDTTYHEIIINGNSRARTFYNPHIIDSICAVNSYNIGLDGRSISSQIARYHLYRLKHEKPRIVIQSVDFFMMGSNKFEREQFLPYFDLGNLYNEICEEDGFSWADKNIPFLRYVGYKDVIFEGLQLHNDLVRCPNEYNKGYKGNEAKWKQDYAYTVDSLKFSYESEQAMRFENFMKELYIDSIKVVLVFGPVYRGSGEDVVTKEEQRMYDYFMGQASLYDFPVLNYMQLDMCKHKDYFYNATHINQKGSDIISIQIAHDIDSIFTLDSRSL